MITIYSELTGIINSSLSLGIPQITPTQKQQLSTHLDELLQFFMARLTMEHVQSNRLGDVVLADLDKGYRRHFADNNYAGYEKAEKPVMCVYSGNNRSKYKIIVSVPVENVPKRQDTSEDISHNRRIIHV